MTRTVAIAISSVLLSGCGSTPPSSPTTGDVVTGSERFGWEQPAADATELATFRYASYLDDARSEAADVSCATVASNGRFSCTCRLPSMSTGTHTLQIAAFVTDGAAVLESSRSGVVRVVKR
jgi:hypothetical protein